MMKKFLCIILSIVIALLSFAGCGKTKNNGKNDDRNDNKIEESTGEPIEINLDFETWVYQVPMKNIFIELPMDPYDLSVFDFTETVFIESEHCISFVGDIHSSATTLEQAQKINIEEYKVGIREFFELDSLTVKEDEYVTINGIEMYRFKGEFDCTRPTGKCTQHVLGYTFIMDGVPCSLIGTVLDEKQSSDVIKDVEDRVDALIKTLRKEA